MAPATDEVPRLPDFLTLPYVFAVDVESKARGQKIHQPQRPVTLTLDFADLTADDLGPSVVNLYRFDETLEGWLLLPAETDMISGRLVARVDHFSTFGIGTSKAELPSTPPNLEGFTVDLCTGNVTATIPLKTPPGTAGLSPRLELRYTSGAIDILNENWIQFKNATADYENTRTDLQASPVGLGWSLDLGAIIRSDKKDANNNTLFYLHQQGETTELQQVSGSTDTFVSKPDGYQRIRKLTGAPNPTGQGPFGGGGSTHEYWLVEGKDGTQYRFGYTPDAEQVAARHQFGGGTTQLAWQWSLDQIKDRSGNTIDIAYQEIKATASNSTDTSIYDQAVYPTEIDYGGNPGQAVAHNRKVLFYYAEDRTDVATNPTLTYTQYYWKKRLSRIEMSVGGHLVRAYDFSHVTKTPYWYPEPTIAAPEPVAVQGKSKLVLTSIVESGAAGDPPLPATALTYYEGQIPAGDYYKLHLKSVENGYGGKTTFAFERHSPDGWYRLKYRFRVSSQSTETGTGSDSTIARTYTYGPSYNKLNAFEYRGHADVGVIDADGHSSRTWFYVRDAVNGKTAADVDVLKSRPFYAERRRSGASSPTTREETDWSYLATRADASFVRVDEVRQYQGSASRKTRYEYDAYGNRTATRELASASDSSPARSKVVDYLPSVTTDRYIVTRPARERVLDASGTAVSTVSFCYDGSTRWDTTIGSGANGDNGSARGLLTAERRLLDATRCVDVVHAYDAFGNETSMTTFGGYGTPDGPLASTDPRPITATYESTYHTFPTTFANVLGHTEQRAYDARWGVLTSVTDPNGGVTDYAYDGFGRITRAQGPTASGPSGSYRPTTEYTYGSPTTSAAGRTTTLLTTRVRTDAGGTATWRSSWQVYDGLGRVIQAVAETTGGVNVTNTWYDTRGQAKKTSVPHIIAGSGGFLEDDWSGFSGPVTTTTYDEFGRAVRVDQPGGPYTETVYDGWDVEGIDANRHKKRQEKDAFGRMVRVREYSGAGPWSEYAVTTYGYDLLDRLVAVDDAVGNHTSISYDLLGRKTGMVDPDMGSWSYAYDALGNLTAQTDAKNQRIDFVYDSLNRLVRKWYPLGWNQDLLTAGASLPTVYDLMELRATVDTDRAAAGLSTGGWTDPAIVPGKDIPIKAAHFTEMRARIQDLWTAAGLGAVPEFSGGTIVPDLRPVRVTDTLDLRVWLSQYESSTYGQSRRARVYQVYDESDPAAGHYGKGRRTHVWDVTGQTTYTWDLLGRLTREARTLDGSSYVATSAFDALGRVVTAAYPDGETLTYAYGANGLLAGLTSSLGTTLVASVDYNALGQPTRATLGSGTTSEVRQSFYGLDGAAQSSAPFGALRSHQWQSASATPLVDWALTYDAGGNITHVDDAANAETFGYTYDHLDRLLTVSGAVNETYTYDQVGNLTSKNGQAYQYPTPGSARPHAVTAALGNTYAYDANGSLVSRSSQTIQYDAERRPSHVDLGYTIARFAYDADGIRRKRGDRFGVVHCLGAYERNVGSGHDTAETVTKYYSALGRLVALRKNGALHWLGADHLRSTTRIADARFTPLDRMRYTPYGASRDAGTALQTDHKFTGQIEDASVGLYWYASRAYDPVLGRFTCPDTLVPIAFDPQTLNRYSYVRGNPLGYVDPDGHGIWVVLIIAAIAASALLELKDYLDSTPDEIEGTPEGRVQELAALGRGAAKQIISLALTGSVGGAVSISLRIYGSGARAASVAGSLMGTLAGVGGENLYASMNGQEVRPEQIAGQAAGAYAAGRIGRGAVHAPEPVTPGRPSVSERAAIRAANERRDGATEVVQSFTQVVGEKTASTVGGIVSRPAVRAPSRSGGIERPDDSWGHRIYDEEFKSPTPVNVTLYIHAPDDEEDPGWVGRRIR